MDVIELFAGVGGFRLGLEKNNKKKQKDAFKVIWSNQWEPSTKIQHASDIYAERFGEDGHINEDISKVELKDIPSHDMLCGGFPCQDYSVARPKNLSKGLEGKKGVLWWEIHRIIGDKKTKYLFLENVDRLVMSPSKQVGKDFAVMVKSLIEMDYVVEWRIINAAEYGMPQKRKRTYIFAYKKDSPIGKKLIAKKMSAEKVVISVVNENSLMTKAFPIKPIEYSMVKVVDLSNDIFEISENFNKDKKDKKPFLSGGIAFGNEVYTYKAEPDYKGKYITIKDILIDEKDVEPEYFVTGEEEIKKWEVAKDKISKERVNKFDGKSYTFKGGAMAFPDSIDKPARTIITSEGGRSASRTTHIIKVNGKFRRLHPIELERLNMFPDNHTQGASGAKRGFLMGNALVVGIVERFGKILSEMEK